MKKAMASVLVAFAVAGVAAPASAQLLNFGGLLKISLIQGNGMNAFNGLNIALLNGNSNLSLVSGGVQP